MTDTKMLQILISGQEVIRKDLKDGFSEVKKGLDENNKRLDKIGLRLAKLEDDTPTIDEFENLEKRVKKVEKVVANL